MTEVDFVIPCIDDNLRTGNKLKRQQSLLMFIFLLFRDRFRTMCNVVGDAIGCAVVERLSRSDFGNDLEANQSQMQEIGISSNISDDISAVSHQNHNVS